MPAPTLFLSIGAKIELNDPDLVITVKAGTADNRMIEKVFAESKSCRVLHSGVMTKVRFIGFKSRDDVVIWHGVM